MNPVIFLYVATAAFAVLSIGGVAIGRVAFGPGVPGFFKVMLNFASCGWLISAGLFCANLVRADVSLVPTSIFGWMFWLIGFVTVAHNAMLRVESEVSE